MTDEQEQKGGVSDPLTGTRDALRAALATIKVSDLPMSKKSVVIDSKTDPKKAIEILVTNKIRAAPVFDKTKNMFVGVLDLRDTVKYALENYRMIQQSKDDVNTSKNMNMKYKTQEKNLNKNKDATASHFLLTSSADFGKQTLTYLSRMRSFFVVRDTDSAVQACEVMARGAHIVGVVDAKKSLLGIISQGQLFQQVCKIWADSKTFEGLAQVPSLEQLHAVKIVKSPVKSIRNNVRAFDAFEKMSRFGLSGLAVVDETGKIIHNTSAVDIKLWLICSDSLETNIDEFLMSIRRMSVIERYPITNCGLSDTLHLAIRKLRATKYHRMWITDENYCPIGVLALTDVFAFFTQDKSQKESANTN